MHAPPTRYVTAGVITALLMAAAGCAGSSPASTSAPPLSSAASTPPAPSPSAAHKASSLEPTAAPLAGYKWAGGSGQGIWIAIPRTWISLNLAKISLSQATRRFATTGIGASTLQADLQSLKKQGALFFADLASYPASAHGFTTNASAVCLAGATTAPGPAAMPGLKAQMRAEYASVQARVLSIAPVSVAGGLAFKAQLILTASTGFRITELQVVILASSGQTCVVTFSTDDPAAFRRIFSTAASTVHVG
jgi:hypothetical protein